MAKFIGISSWKVRGLVRFEDNVTELNIPQVLLFNSPRQTSPRFPVMPSSKSVSIWIVKRDSRFYRFLSFHLSLFPLLSEFGRIYESIRTQRYSKIRGTYPAPCSTTSSAQWTLNFRPVTRWITPDDPWTFGLASFQPSLPSSLHESSSIQLCFQLSEEFVWNLSTPV